MLNDLILYAQVIFGIGLVIFVHEAGHFFAARWCKVRVEVFSLGFGPRLVGWRRGATLYQIAAIPLGGYVKMAGEMRESGREPRPDELGAKGVWQRFFIYSGGVLMNVAFAIVVFPIVLAAGVPSLEPVISKPAKGSAAWHARLEPGTRILEANGNEVFDFLHIPSEVAVGGSDPVTFEILRPGASTPQEITIEPEYSELHGFYMIGVQPALDPELRFKVPEDGPAWRAGLRSGDRLVDVVGGGHEALPIEERFYLLTSAHQPLTVRIARDGEESLYTIEPDRGVSEKQYRFGIQPAANLVADLRPGPIVDALGIEIEDRVVTVNDRPIHRSGDVLEALFAGDGPVVFEVDRNGSRLRLEGPVLTPEEAIALDEDLHVTQDVSSARIAVMPGHAAALAGIEDGDVVVSIDGGPVGNWDGIASVTKDAASRRREVVFDLARETGEGVTHHEIAVSASGLHTADYGLIQHQATYVYKTDGFGDSLEAGLAASWRFLSDTWMTLRRMVKREVRTDNLGGIITIGRVSYDWASQGLAKLFFFLCMLSVNLAFLNVLPIPVLDGGHLFFCLVEAVKGSPVSERTLGYSQVVGLVLILSLMVYVTYVDVLRIL